MGFLVPCSKMPRHSTQQLIAIAVALTTQCPYCVELHVQAARKEGATAAMLINMPAGLQCQGQCNASLAPGIDGPGIGDQFRAEMRRFDGTRYPRTHFAQLSWQKEGRAMRTGRRNKSRLIRFCMFDSRRLKKACAGTFSAQPQRLVRGKVI